MILSKEYIAGFIDGEGFIGISIRKNGVVRYRIEVSQKYKEVLDMIQQDYRGFVKKEKLREIWKWKLYKKIDIIKLLNDITPYLIVKQKEAKKLIDYLITQNRKEIKFEKDCSPKMDLNEAIYDSSKPS